MPRIPNRFNYEPPHATTRKWPACPQRGTLRVSRVEMPPLFSDDGIFTDGIWFMVAFIGEVVGLVITIWGGANSGGAIFIFATITVIMFVFCDIFFAIKLHRNVGRNNKLKSMLILENNPVLRAQYQAEMKEGRLGDTMYQLGIILIAIIKLVGIALLGIFATLVLYLPFLIIYAIVAYVHIKHTGYFFAEVTTQKLIDRGYNRGFAVNGANPAQERHGAFNTTALLNLPITSGNHSITLIDAGTFSYAINTLGVLLDEDITTFIIGQTRMNQTEIFNACRDHQITNWC